jgi:hypothetical protein
MSLQFGFVILWQKAFGVKAALKTLVKLTPECQQKRKEKFYNIGSGRISVALKNLLSRQKYFLLQFSNRHYNDEIKKAVPFEKK